MSASQELLLTGTSVLEDLKILGAIMWVGCSLSPEVDSGKMCHDAKNC